MSSQQIITVAYALILSQIMYVLPTWGGFLSDALIDKINAFLSTWNALGILVRAIVFELIVSCDHDLFTKATGYGHCLHHLLTATRPVDHLRPRGHPFQLYPAVTDLHKRSFIVRTLYNFMWLMCIVYFICSFFHLCAFLYLLCAFVILPVIKIIIYLHTYLHKRSFIVRCCLISRD